MTNREVGLVWFRHDLRLADHPALTAAVERSETILPVFLWAPEDEGAWPPGAASRWYVHYALDALQQSLKTKGSNLLIRKGESCLEQLQTLISETNVSAVYWNLRYAPPLAKRDAEIAEALKADGIEVHTFSSYLLHDPDAVRTGSGGPYKVYTPFWRKFDKVVDISDPLPVPRMGERLAPDAWPDAIPLNDLHLLPEIDWDEGFYDVWTPGEDAAHEALEAFIDEDLIDYPELRNRPDLNRTSQLSPRLHCGELSPRQVWTAVRSWIGNAAMKESATVFLKEMAWREFSYHVLVHHPETTTEPLKPKFEDFAWKTDEPTLKAWQRGRTGYPIVDAGMRQLWHIGWMHNRVRMIAASFLTKDLRIPWQDGAAWFWDTLVDADLGNNTMGWQWSAGSGADAQPFFRIFNPVSQGRKFDPDGAYVRRWIPELQNLPDRYLHAPWETPEEVLTEAGVTLGETYPHPIVDHSEARKAALDAYNAIK